MFNENDIQTKDGMVSISSGVQSEGERESKKVIQHPKNRVENLEKADTEQKIDNQPEKEPLDENQEANTSSTIPFPSVADPSTEVHDEDAENEGQQRYGRGQRPRKPKGAYKDINEGLIAAISHFEDLNEDKNMSASVYEDYYCLYLDIALLGSHSSDPKTLDEALRGPESKHWQEVLEYEINQLENLGT